MRSWKISLAGSWAGRRSYTKVILKWRCIIRGSRKPSRKISLMNDGIGESKMAPLGVWNLKWPVKARGHSRMSRFVIGFVFGWGWPSI